MISLSKTLQIHVSPSVTVEDLFLRPDSHYWKVQYNFPEYEVRDKFATPNGKSYGSSASFKEIYKHLKTDFIGAYFRSNFFDSDVKEEVDALLRGLNRTMGINVEQYITENDMVEKFKRQERYYSKRYNDSLSSLEELGDKASKLWNSIESMYEELYQLSDTIPLTRRGAYDKRTKGYKSYVKLSESLSKASQQEKENKMLVKQVETKARKQSEKLQEVQEAKVKHKNLLEQAQMNVIDLSSVYYDKAEEVAEHIRQDIITKGMNGQLPIQNLPLAESTIRRRAYAGIPAVPRFWATGQLIESIHIKATLV